MEILELKNTMSKVKNSLNRLNNRMEMLRKSQWIWRQINGYYVICKTDRKNIFKMKELHCRTRAVLSYACELGCDMQGGLEWGGLVPRPGIEPGPLHWEHRVLATGPPGKPPKYCVYGSLKKKIKENDYNTAMCKIWPKHTVGPQTCQDFTERWQVKLYVGQRGKARLGHMPCPLLHLPAVYRVVPSVLRPIPEPEHPETVPWWEAAGRLWGPSAVRSWSPSCC